MNIYNMRMSSSVSPEELFDILEEDSLVVAPVIASYLVANKSSNSTLEPKDFDSSYSNETGRALSKIHRIISCIMVTSKSYGDIKERHCSPIFSEPVLKDTFFKIQNQKHLIYVQEKSIHKETLIACENMAFMLSVMGREVFIPTDIDRKEEDEQERKENKSALKINTEVLPGYECIRYSPKTNISSIVAVLFERVNKYSQTELKNPLFDVSAYQEFIRRQFSDSENPVAEKIKRLFDYAQKGIISEKSALFSIEGGESAMDCALNECLTLERKMTRAVLKTCPDCKKEVDSRCDNCNLVYGRRGWRQIGVYDG